MRSRKGKTKIERSRYGKYDDDSNDEQEPLDDQSNRERRTRRSRRNREESEEEEEKDVRRVARKSRYNSDDEVEEKCEYSKKKENKSTKTRGRSYEDDVSDDEPARRNKRSNRYSDDDEERELSDKEDDRRSNRRSRRNRQESDEEEEITDKKTGSRTKRESDKQKREATEEKEERISRRPRRRNQESEEEDSDVEEDIPKSRLDATKHLSSDGEDMQESKQKNPFNKYEEPVKKEEENPFSKYEDTKPAEEPVEEEEDISSVKEKELESHVEEEKQEINRNGKPRVASKKVIPFAKFATATRDNSIDKIEGNKRVSSFGKENLKSVKKMDDKRTSSLDMKVATKQTSVDKEGGGGQKKRRRDKDASTAILDVINWSRGTDESYVGSDVVPEIKLAEPELKNPINNHIDEEKETNNEEKVKEGEELEMTKESNGNIKNTDDEVEVFENDLNERRKKEEERREKEEEEKKEKEKEEGDESRTTTVASVNVKQCSPKSDINNDKVTGAELQDSLDFLNRLPDVKQLSGSDLLNNLMDTYLNQDYLIGHSRPPTLETPKKRTLSDNVEKMEELEKKLKNIPTKNKKQPPPPIRNKPSLGSRSWDDPREQQRIKNKEKVWPPKEPPTDAGSYVVESYGQTDPYSKTLIKDIQRSKREEEEKREAEKRAQIISENTKPVSHLRSTFTHKPSKPHPGAQRPEINIAEERSWIKHEKKPVVFDAPPDEPDWMTLIRNRRWKSTVKARFPCKSSDKTDFERRSTTPKNWRRLAKDKNALRMLSEIVGIGAEGEELFMRLASQRQKLEDDQEALDKMTEEELMAYEVARETLGEDTAYNLQMDNPLPAARMRPLHSTSTVKEGSIADSTESLNTLNTSNYPFTTSQLEAAYLTNQLLRLHPEEFRKLMSLERSRQATLRWQFSADPFDSVHDHQSLPFEIALLASEEPRVQQAMKRILATSQDNYSSVFSGSNSTTPAPRIHRTRSDAGYRASPMLGSDSDYDGYESGHSISSSSSVGGNVVRGRKKKKAPIPLPKRPRGRSVSPSMLNRRQNSADNYVSGPQLNTNSAKKQLDDDREVHAHGFLSGQEMALSEEIAKLQELTSNIGRDIGEGLKGIESLEDRKKGFFEEAIRNETFDRIDNPAGAIDLQEIASRRNNFIEKDRQSNVKTDVRDSIPKTSHKVRRINSNAQLDAVFRRRRRMSESNTENESEEESRDKEEISSATTKEMSNLMDDINNTFGV